MVSQRKGLGGPQSLEVLRMLKSQNKEMDNQQAWLQSQQEKLEKSKDQLNSAFNSLK